MRRSAVLTVAVAAAVLGTLAATVPGALAGSKAEQASEVRRESGWDVIPAGKTVTGVVGGECVATAKNQECAAVASIFPHPPAGIAPENMGIAGGLVEHPNCAGDVDDPLASPGILCIYPAEGEIVNVALNGEGSYSAQAYGIYDGKYGFKVAWNANGAGSSAFYAVWAYQAP